MEKVTIKTKTIVVVTMQKVINALAVLSFLGVAGIVGGGAAVYLNRGKIIDGVKSQAMEMISGAMLPALDAELPAALPDALPDTTGGVLPF